MQQQTKCILVGAGEYHAEKIDYQEGDFVIAVDGGLNYCPEAQIAPNLIVGDFDSVSEKAIKQYEQMGTEFISLPTQKDDTDMLYAVKCGLQKGYKEFVLYGATGGRVEHTLANLQVLLFIKNQGGNGSMVDCHGKIFLLKNESMTFETEKNGYLNLFAMEKAAKGVSIRGLKYELSDAVIHNDFPIGISNEFLGKPATISVSEGVLICIESKK